MRRLLTSGQSRPPPGQIATRDDVAACFRLLLGRDPNAKERQGHMAQTGQPLERVVAGYLNSLEFSRRRLLRTETSSATPVPMDGFILYADPNDAAVGRHILGGEYEPEVTVVIQRLLRPGMAVVDLGANVGYFAMMAAHLVGTAGFVLAVEPNPDNVRLLEASRQANGFEHVSVAQLAAGRRIGVLVLHATHSNGTTSALDANADALLSARTVACVPLDSLVPTGRRIDLIKIDVEGAEYNALLGAQRLLDRDRPIIVSEFSPGLLPGISGIDGPGYLAWLHRLGYSVDVIQPDGGLEPAGQDVRAVMAAYERRGTDHIDLLATPI